jgi:hypothetical protein
MTPYMDVLLEFLEYGQRKLARSPLAIHTEYVPAVHAHRHGSISARSTRDQTPLDEHTAGWPGLQHAMNGPS